MQILALSYEVILKLSLFFGGMFSKDFRWYVYLRFYAMKSGWEINPDLRWNTQPRFQVKYSAIISGEIFSLVSRWDIQPGIRIWNSAQISGGILIEDFR